MFHWGFLLVASTPSTQAEHQPPSHSPHDLPPVLYPSPSHASQTVPTERPPAPNIKTITIARCMQCAEHQSKLSVCYISWSSLWLPSRFTLEDTGSQGMCPNSRCLAREELGFTSLAFEPRSQTSDNLWPLIQRHLCDRAQRVIWGWGLRLLREQWPNAALRGGRPACLGNSPALCLPPRFNFLKRVTGQEKIHRAALSISTGGEERLLYTCGSNGRGRKPLSAFPASAPHSSTQHLSPTRFDSMLCLSPVTALSKRPQGRLCCQPGRPDLQRSMGTNLGSRVRQTRVISALQPPFPETPGK